MAPANLNIISGCITRYMMSTARKIGSSAVINTVVFQDLTQMTVTSCPITWERSGVIRCLNDRSPG